MVNLMINKKEIMDTEVRKSILDDIWDLSNNKSSQNNWSSVSDSGHFNSLEWRSPKMLGINIVNYEY